MTPLAVDLYRWLQSLGYAASPDAMRRAMGRTGQRVGSARAELVEAGLLIEEPGPRWRAVPGAEPSAWRGRRDEVLLLLRAHGPMMRGELAERMGVSRRTASRYLSRLGGSVECGPDGRWRVASR